VRRTHHPYRLSAVFSNTEELKEQLKSFSLKSTSNNLVKGKTRGNTSQIVYVYSGQGSQWWGMGRALLAEQHVFRTVVYSCFDLYKKISGISLYEEFEKAEVNSRMHETYIAQPALFA